MNKIKIISKYALRTLIVTLLLGITLGLVGVSVFASQLDEAEIPESPTSMNQSKPIKFLASDGETVLATIQPEDGVRTVVPSYMISKHMKDAVVAAEDKHFWHNPGFSVVGTAGAVVKHLKNDPNAGGGSGITQQLIKNTVTGDEYSLDRKWNELLSSVNLTAKWTKDDIITAYLNTVYFGRGALGVQEAAQAYFGVNAGELDPSQSALLAGIIQAPSKHDPFVNPESSHYRFEYVKQQLIDNGSVSPEEANAMEFPEVKEYNGAKASTGLDGANGHIITQALDELQDAGFSKDDLHNIGANVVTTIDIDKQNFIVNKAQEEKKRHGVNISIATINPKNGAIIGIYGGDNGTGYDLSNNPQMTGSTFKVFPLAAALDHGISLDTPIDSSNYVVNGVVTQNDGGQQSGMVSIREATKQSLNTVFYRLQTMYPGGSTTTREYAHRMGVDAPLSEPDGSVAQSIVLGSYGTSPLQLANGFATIANDGVRNDRHIVEHVLTTNGQQVYKSDSHETQVISSDVTRNIDSALAPIAAYSNGNQLTNGKTGYLKTGTVALDGYYNRDALAAGYTDDAATAVWVGSLEDGTPLVSPIEGSIWGAGLPSRIWRDVMNYVG